LTADEVLRAVTELRPDVVLLDLNMPELKGLDACRQIRRANPQTGIVILIGTNDVEIQEKAFSLGASGYVLKHLMSQELVGAIQRALLGDKVISCREDRG